MSLDEPLSQQGCRKFNRIIHIKLKYFFLIALFLLLIPRVAQEAWGFSGPPHKDYKWDTGFLKAPVLVKTVISPKPREVKVVKGFGNGTCVPYARHRTGIKLYGNAATFLSKAVEKGYSTFPEPVLGGIMVTNESTGHVAVVEKIDTKKIYVSEQNVKGLYIVSHRWFDLGDKRIIGYIY